MTFDTPVYRKAVLDVVKRWDMGPEAAAQIIAALNRAAPAAEPVPLTLDAAWREAEAALPEAGWLSPLDGRWVITTGAWAIDIRRVESGDGYFEPVVDGYYATVKVESSAEPFAMRGDWGVTPAEALRALANSILAALASPDKGEPRP